MRSYYCVKSYFLFLTLTVGVLTSSTVALGQSRETPELSKNAAAHYNRAMLLLTSLPLETRELLDQPVFAIFENASKEEVDAAISPLVFEGRHAIRAALEGSSKEECAFGIDYVDVGRGVVATHAPLMLHLNRLLILAGIDAQIDGNSERALHHFVAALRMGHHLANEPTLIEMLVGMEMMENAYFSLAFWGTRCTDAELVQQALGHLRDSSEVGVRPQRTMANEAAILGDQIDRIVAEFPDGRWAEILLEAWGEFSGGMSQTELKEKATAVAKERGMPDGLFDNAAQFTQATKRFREVHVAYFSEAVACLEKKGAERLTCADTVYNKFKPQFEELGDSRFIDIRSVVHHVATNEAELVMAEAALSAATKRIGNRYPATLKDVYGGVVPSSPYNGAALEYRVLEDGADFMLAVPEAEVNGAMLPRVEFSSVRPTADAQ